MAKEHLLWKTNKTIEMLNSKVGTKLSSYKILDKTINQFEYIFLNASQAYTKKIIITQRQLEIPMYVNNIIEKSN